MRMEFHLAILILIVFLLGAGFGVTSKFLWQFKEVGIALVVAYSVYIFSKQPFYAIIAGIIAYFVVGVVL